MLFEPLQIRTVWPKKLGQAPESDDTVPPSWPEAGAALVANEKDGRVIVRWQAATDNEAMYGYEVLRGEDLGGNAVLLTHHASVRALSTRYEDSRVMPGVTYRYAVRPHDLAGNRRPLSAPVTVHVAM